MKNPLVIYWSPYVSTFGGGNNMLYQEPETLFKSLMDRKSDDVKDRTPWSYLSCPAASNRLKRTFVFRSPITAEYEFDFTDKENPIVNPISQTYYEYSVNRRSVLKDSAIISFQIKHLAFCEESVEALFHPPMMFRPGYMQYGTSIPGSFDISKWFRPHVFEVQMWDQKGIFRIEEGEPLFCLEIPVNDRDIILKRFRVSENLVSYSNNIVDSSRFIGHFSPLSKKYKWFERTSMAKLIMKEIRNNLVD